jgi:RNA polymerase sigma-70 factor (sigma-E family)
VAVVECPEEFTEFAAAEMARLRRTAFLLCGDWHAAEDLTQVALTKTLLAWRRIRRHENAHAYAHRSLVNAYLSHRRTRRSREVPVDRIPESGSVAPAGATAELRIVLMDALATLPPQARAVVVLRYWEDMSIDQVAAILRCSAGNVKSQSARALEKLRATLGDSLPELALTD